jgi:hypothetical protein
MQDNPKAGPDVSRRGFLKGVAIAGVSAVIPADKLTNSQPQSKPTKLRDKTAFHRKI